MIYKRPLRLTTLHLEQRFLIDEDTFIKHTPSKDHLFPDSQSLDYTCQKAIRPVLLWAVSRQGQKDCVSIGDGDGMLPMRCQ